MRTVPTTSHPDGRRAIPDSNILLGEPDADLRAAFTRLLRRAGHHVHIAGDADAVIETAARIRPDLIIINLQELGVPICRTLRATAETAGTPVILLSTTLRLDARIAAEAGANAYLALPVHIAALLHHVHILLRKPEWFDRPA